MIEKHFRKKRANTMGNFLKGYRLLLTMLAGVIASLAPMLGMPMDGQTDTITAILFVLGFFLRFVTDSKVGTK